jgi:hypothetical protein
MVSFYRSRHELVFIFRNGKESHRIRFPVHSSAEGEKQAILWLKVVNSKQR